MDRDQLASVMQDVLKQQKATFEEMAATAAKEAASKLYEQQEAKIKSLQEKLDTKSSLDRITLKNPNNQKQLDENREILDQIDNAFENLQKGNIDEAKGNLKTGKKHVLKRIKLIRIADRNGWDVAKEYNSDELASDSDDQKEIAKAIRLANAKRKRDSLVMHNRAHPYKQNSSSRSNLNCWKCGRVGHMMNSCFATTSNVNYPAFKPSYPPRKS